MTMDQQGQEQPQGDAEEFAAQTGEGAGLKAAQAPESAEGGAEAAASPWPEDPGELIAMIEQERARNEASRDQLLRARAEVENISRRKAKELENAHKFALENFVRELLQVRDSLELGQSAASESDADVVKLREGMDLTVKLLGDVMTKFGVERVDPMHQPFNPEFHQAMSMQPRADVAPNTVVAVIQRGYTLNGRLVRPALVMVSQAIEQG
ncbi:nucleotide exchange factor GrpE [Thiorhodovibrio frisius]|uniref:Protein GrpE n=1 Tax=Thiorhodovibrio frisius TaxID=631362 RepID=H8YXS9_9GAMM|nr:nucleotide exchange factor GrpE [Thiorhodovibrio frisius]EIC23255.1 molecular chaperone GrpE (heat shock protein) [Thiorhodovibrio frisius]WPL23669.1 HSP-70 cofactor [Thiorhodovibrio frisius]